MTQRIRQRIVKWSKKVKKRYLSLVRLDTDKKGHESPEKTVPCHNIHVEMSPRAYN